MYYLVPRLDKTSRQPQCQNCAQKEHSIHKIQPFLHLTISRENFPKVDQLRAPRHLSKYEIHETQYAYRPSTMTSFRGKFALQDGGGRDSIKIAALCQHGRPATPFIIEIVFRWANRRGFWGSDNKILTPLHFPLSGPHRQPKWLRLVLFQSARRMPRIDGWRKIHQK